MVRPLLLHATPDRVLAGYEAGLLPLEREDGIFRDEAPLRLPRVL